MSRFTAFVLIIIIATLIAGFYGIIHDQFTYSISPEYYTKFKFYQFNLATAGEEAIFPNPRIQVSIVGFMATWWMGLPIGLILGLTGLIHKEGNRMFKVTLRACLITTAIALITGLAGLAYGHFNLAGQPIENFSGWYIPENVVDLASFIKVGSMHNFSYLGGLFGLLGGIFYSVKKKQ